MDVQHRVPLAPFTTLRLGGPAASLVRLDFLGDFGEVADLMRRNTEIPISLGGGSNVIVGDDGCEATVLHINTSGIDFAPDGDRVHVTVQAGHSLNDLVNATIAEGLTGMETLVGIPGTVGAVPIQNVGAYGQEASDIVVGVEAWDWQQHQKVSLSNQDCGFAHRASIFKRSRRWTILTVTLALRPSPLSVPISYRQVANVLDVSLGEQVPLTDAASAVLEVRRGKGMVLDPTSADNRNAGSVFLSPIIDSATAEELRARRASVHDFPDGTTRVSASWLIKQAGFSLGTPLEDGVRISNHHYTLVAENGATAKAFIAATDTVRHQVRQHMGVTLTPELDLIGIQPGW